MSTDQSAWSRLVQTGFRLLYEDLSWTYDAVSHVVSLGQWQAWRRACRPFLIGSRVLELGFGPGHLQLELSKDGYEVAGLDRSSQMARTAARRLRDAAYPARVVVGNAQRLSFSAGYFNSVVATFPTPYIADPATLVEVVRVLAPGGRLVVVPEAQLQAGGVIRRLIERAYQVTGQRSAQPGEAVIHWSDILAQQIAAAGLTVTIHHIDLPGSRVSVVVGQK